MGQNIKNFGCQLNLKHAFSFLNPVRITSSPSRDLLHLLCQSKLPRDVSQIESGYALTTYQTLPYPLAKESQENDFLCVTSHPRVMRSRRVERWTICLNGSFVGRRTIYVGPFTPLIEKKLFILIVKHELQAISMCDKDADQVHEIRRTILSPIPVLSYL